MCPEGLSIVLSYKNIFLVDVKTRLQHIYRRQFRSHVLYILCCCLENFLQKGKLFFLFDDLKKNAIAPGSFIIVVSFVLIIVFRKFNHFL